MWLKYKGTMKARLGVLAYDDPMTKMKKLKQTWMLGEYLMAFDSLLDKSQLNEK